MRVTASSLPLVEPTAVEDVFATCFGKIDDLGAASRFWLCVPGQCGDQECLIVRTKLIVPGPNIFKMAREAMAAVDASAFGRYICSARVH